MHQQIIHS
jgi:hypothetical protein